MPEHDTNTSQLGAFLLAYALELRQDKDADLVEEMANCRTAIRAASYGYGFELVDLEKALTKRRELMTVET